jgi:hypothetical protein
MNKSVSIGKWFGKPARALSGGRICSSRPFGVVAFEHGNSMVFAGVLGDRLYAQAKWREALK